MADNAWRWPKARMDDMIQIHTAFYNIRGLKSSTGNLSINSAYDIVQNRSDGT